nr:hypothetical protein [Tanacetum cinerariifolium]
MGNVKKSVAERIRHKRQYDRMMKERQMQSRESKVVSSKVLDASLVVTECSGIKSDEHIINSCSGTYITHVVDADIRPVNDQEPFAEVHLTTQHNVFANEKWHTDQFEPSYDTYLLEKVDRNTTPDSTNMCHRGGEIDQDDEQDQVKSLMWKPTGRIFKTAGFRWIPTGKMLIDCSTKVDSEPLYGSNDDITNPYECDQTLNVSACTLNLSAGLTLHRQMASGDNTLCLAPQRKERYSMADMNILVNDASVIAPQPGQMIKSCRQAISCQLDEQWFNLHKDILRDALDITPTINNSPFAALPSSKTAGYNRPRHPVLQILKNLATASRGKKKTTHLLIPSVRFTKLIIHHLETKHNIHPRSSSPLHYSHDESVLNTLRYVGKDGRKIFGMPIPDALLTDEIKRAPYYGEYQEHVAKYQQHLDAEHGKAAEGGATKYSKATKVTKPKAAKATKPASDPKPKPAPTQPPKVVPEKKRKLRRTSMPAKASGLAESPSLDAKLALTDSETESDDKVPKINTGDHDEGQAGPNPGLQDEEFTTTAYPNVQENLKLPSKDLVIPEEPISSTGTLSSLKNLEKELSFTD